MQGYRTTPIPQPGSADRPGTSLTILVKNSSEQGMSSVGNFVFGFKSGDPFHALRQCICDLLLRQGMSQIH